MRYETVWTFRTARFEVSLSVGEIHGYRYDGDDDDGTIQIDLDSGRLVAFDSVLRVKLDDRVVGEYCLGGSVYEADGVDAFWTAHRSKDAMDRNCSILRTVHGETVSICHYFPDMVRQAIAEARYALRDTPRLRVA